MISCKQGKTCTVVCLMTTESTLSTPGLWCARFSLVVMWCDKQSTLACTNSVTPPSTHALATFCTADKPDQQQTLCKNYFVYWKTYPFHQTLPNSNYISLTVDSFFWRKIHWKHSSQQESLRVCLISVSFLFLVMINDLGNDVSYDGCKQCNSLIIL